MSSRNQPSSATLREPSAAMAAQVLRERIGQENVTQSSVLASRRLDEALQRLEQSSVGKRMVTSRADRTQEPAPSVAQWKRPATTVEPTDRRRFETNVNDSTPHTSEMSSDAIEALFGTPVDVTILSTKAKVAGGHVLKADVHSPREFVAAWKVDEFVVPSTIDQLFLADSLAEQLAARLADARTDGLQTIAVTSSQSGEGRSTVAMGLALSIAFSGLRVALVDADRHGVKIATDLQLDLDQSWAEAIREHLPLEEIAVASQADSLTLLPLLDREGGADFEPAELNRILVRLRESFDMIVIDCGPMAMEEIILCGAALIVHDVQRTGVAEVEAISRLLSTSGVRGIGIIENFCV